VVSPGQLLQEARDVRTAEESPSRSSTPFWPKTRMIAGNSPSTTISSSRISRNLRNLLAKRSRLKMTKQSWVTRSSWRTPNGHSERERASSLFRRQGRSCHLAAGTEVDPSCPVSRARVGVVGPKQVGCLPQKKQIRRRRRYSENLPNRRLPMDYLGRRPVNDRDYSQLFRAVKDHFHCRLPGELFTSCGPTSSPCPRSAPCHIGRRRRVVGRRS
jgi:hypothetical protein